MNIIMVLSDVEFLFLIVVARGQETKARFVVNKDPKRPLLIAIPHKLCITIDIRL